jgi:hypothetical protein
MQKHDFLLSLVGPTNRLWPLKPALIADFVDRHSPHRICSPDAIGCPPIYLVETLRANVTPHDPQKRMSKSKFEKIRASCQHKGVAHSTTPLFGIHIERTRLSIVRQIRVARWRGRGKSMDQPFFDSHDGPRLKRVKAREIVRACSIFGMKLIQVFFRKKPPVGHLPRPGARPVSQ